MKERARQKKKQGNEVSSSSNIPDHFQAILLLGQDMPITEDLRALYAQKGYLLLGDGAESIIDVWCNKAIYIPQRLL